MCVQNVEYAMSHRKSEDPERWKATHAFHTHTTQAPTHDHTYKFISTACQLHNQAYIDFAQFARPTPLLDQRAGLHVRGASMLD